MTPQAHTTISLAPEEVGMARACFEVFLKGVPTDLMQPIRELSRRFDNLRYVKEPKLKLYVWTGFCPNVGGGLAVAVAETVDEAKLLVQAAHRPLCVWDWGTLEIHDIEPCAYCVEGA